MNEISLDAYKEEWLKDVLAGSPSTLEKGRRFGGKLITQWLDVEESSDDLIYCDGSGDGGIDVAFLQRGESNEEDQQDGDTWYLVQSKYGSAFAGQETLLRESQKLFDTLSGNNTSLSSLAKDVVERISGFISCASDRDKLFLVFATDDPLSEQQRRVLEDIRAMGRNRFGAIFDVESVSIATIYQRAVEENEAVIRLNIPLEANLVASEEGLWVGATKLTALYSFLKEYRSAAGNLDQIYEKNVRRFLGARGKVNKSIQQTLETEPEKFGLYNNGVTLVVEDIKEGDSKFTLTDPYIVNGCQTTRSIWDVLVKKLETGGTGQSASIEKWRSRLEKSIVILKVVKVGFQGEDLLTQITRYTNSQNAVREKDFVALTSDFQSWQKGMADRYKIYLEIQRGGWDSQKALQRQNKSAFHFSVNVNAFDLLKVYASGWLGEAGQAFGKNPPFLPNGAVFKKIVNAESEHRFGLEDLYAAYKLQESAVLYKFGRGGIDSRRQTKFLYYMTVIELLKSAMVDAGIDRSPPNITKSLLAVLESEDATRALFDTAVQIIDEYMNPESQDSIVTEPAFNSKHAGNLNAFLKWEQLAKNDDGSPKYRGLLRDTYRVMKRAIGGVPAPADIIKDLIKAG